ncbi:MAG: metal-dependent transcriptional regulator [Saprospiraceae bacterium]
MLSFTEENYLKAIFKLSEREKKAASTNAIAKEMQTSAASVTDMLKRLAEKKLLNYEKYKGVTLSESGQKIATNLIRKHRLWEVFLVEKLHFSWDEVHDIAEQLEHIHSEHLIDRLDEYLAFPKFDPHGDPIPDAEGKFTFRKQIPLSQLHVGRTAIVVGVQEHSAHFLQYLDRLDLGLGSQLEVLEKFDFDDSLRLDVNATKEQIISIKVSQNLLVQEVDTRTS